MRRARTPGGRPFTLTDTVGFVRHLPHQLVDAFRSTLEEVAEADLILHVVDGSDAEPRAQIAAVREVLGQIERRRRAELVVINKADEADPDRGRGAAAGRARSPWWSPPVPGPGSMTCSPSFERLLPRPTGRSSVTVPYDRGDLVFRAHQEGEVLAVRHGQAAPS